MDKNHWQVKETHDHYSNGNEPKCNKKLADAVKGCSTVVIDAPLWLKSSKDWEQELIHQPKLTRWMRPAKTSGILSHAWRAHDLVRELRRPKPRIIIREIFPAAWFWLCNFDKNVNWKMSKAKDGEFKDESLAKGKGVKRRKRDCWKQMVLTAKSTLKIDVSVGGDDWVNGLSMDETDALPCVLCAILLAEKNNRLTRLDETKPPVLFPPRDLWHPRVPPELSDLFSLAGE